MRKLFVCLCIFIYYTATAQDIDSVWFVSNYAKKEVYIAMRDRVRLFTSVYMPKDSSEAHPILMTRTPYSCARYGEDKFKNFWATLMKEYLKEGYIIITQDVRGRWMSEGEFMDIRPFNSL